MGRRNQKRKRQQSSTSSVGSTDMASIENVSTNSGDTVMQHIAEDNFPQLSSPELKALATILTKQNKDLSFKIDQVKEEFR